jgi:mono/diheme cytochrome c family protein
MSISPTPIILLAAVALAATGLAGEETPAAAAREAAGAVAAEELSDSARREAAGIYSARCAGCHGAQGKADGAMAAALSPRPRDLTTAEWQQSATDEYIEQIILEGGTAVGKSMMMPGNPDLAGKPEVVRALRALVRQLAD